MRDLEHLGKEARRELARFESSPGLSDLVEAWPQAVGAEIARNAWPARVGRDGTLHVATSSSAWAFELAQLEGHVLSRLRANLAESVPKRLRFAPGPLPALGGGETEGPAREPLVASPKACAEAAALAAEIEDDELRVAVARAAAASLERAATDRSV